MSKKKSLGYNPLVHSSKDKATLDFIKNKLKDNKSSSSGEITSITLTCEIEEKLLEDVVKIAEQNDLSIANVINNCLKKYIADNT